MPETLNRTVAVARFPPPFARRQGVARWGAGAALLATLCARFAGAAEAEQCSTAYESAQELRRGSRLVEARVQLLTCTSASCPSFITTDCRRWLDEVESALPSVVFAVRGAGRDLERVLVSVDGRLLTDRLDGRAVAIDPGKHTFTFRAPGHPDVRLDAIINEGSKHRLIAVELTPAPAAPPSAPPSSGRASAMRPLARGLFVVSALGVAGFAGLGLWGLHDERRLREECAPGCAPARLDRVHRQYLAADVSLGLGVAALAVGVYVHRRPAAPDGPPRFALRLLEGGASVSLGDRF